MNTITREELLSVKNWDCITWELYATTKCNLNCRYCYNANKNALISEPQYSIEDLIRFFKAYARRGDCLSFTGGEPFIRTQWITDIIENTTSFDFEYEIYTNGYYLDKVPPSILNHFKNIILSIDGNQKQNDSTRGIGTYEKIIGNLRLIRSYFTGEIIARITVTSENDLNESVRSLINLGYFDVIYWQFENTWDLKHFSVEKKRKQLDALIDFWIENLKKGKQFRLQPFIAMVVRLLDQLNEDQYHPNTDKLPPCTLGCGAGHHYFQIFTTGDLYACPEIVMQSNNYLGNIRTGIEKRIELKDFPNTQPCMTCDEFPICHCRCLHCTPNEYCILIKHVISKLRQEIPLIKSLINNGTINKEFLRIKERLEEIF